MLVQPWVEVINNFHSGFRSGLPPFGMGKKRYGVDVRKALSARLCQPSESLRHFLVRSFDTLHQQRTRELLSNVSSSLHEMLDKSLVLELEEEKPLVAPEQPMFSIAEVVDKASFLTTHRYYRF